MAGGSRTKCALFDLRQILQYLKLDVSVSDEVPDFADSGSISSYAEDAISWAYEKGIMTGKDGNRIDPSGNATRAEVAAVIMRFSELISGTREMNK